jgi:hypothetical protein
MKVLRLTLILAACVLGHQAQAGTYGCTEADKAAANHNASDPTKPGTIGGCGTGHYKVHQFKSSQKKLEDQNILQGPNRLGTGQNF